MSREVEIELTFLAAFIPKGIEKIKPKLITDTYIPEESDFSPLRLRRKENGYFITRKMPVQNGDFSSHNEDTIKIEQDEYLALSKCSNKTVSKHRYSMVIDQMKADVDIFTDGLKGLVLIEFEFDNKEAKKSFKKPDCCLLDVTQERTILGGQLAGKNYKDIESWLNEQGYKKII